VVDIPANNLLEGGGVALVVRVDREDRVGRVVDTNKDWAADSMDLTVAHIEKAGSRVAEGQVQEDLVGEVEVFLELRIVESHNVPQCQLIRQQPRRLMRLRMPLRGSKSGLHSLRHRVGDNVVLLGNLLSPGDGGGQPDLSQERAPEVDLEDQGVCSCTKF
jgi:hypothetical protein